MKNPKIEININIDTVNFIFEGEKTTVRTEKATVSSAKTMVKSEKTTVNHTNPFTAGKKRSGSYSIDDNILVLYATKYGRNGRFFKHKKELVKAFADAIGRSEGSFKGVESNHNFLLGKSGLSHYGKNAEYVVSHFGKLSEPKLAKMVKNILGW